MHNPIVSIPPIDPIANTVHNTISLIIASLFCFLSVNIRTSIDLASETIKTDDEIIEVITLYFILK